MLLTTVVAQASSCSTPYQDATVVRPAVPIYPNDAHERRVAMVYLVVVISPDAKIESVRIAQSSGDAALDAAAMRAARESVFTPKIANCRPIESQYVFRARLDPEKSNPQRASSSSPVTSSPSPQPYAAQYARMCGSNRSTEAARANAQRLRSGFPGYPGETEILTAVRKALSNPPNGLPNLSAVHYLSVAMFAYVPPRTETLPKNAVRQDVVKIGSGVQTIYAAVRFDSDARYVDIKPMKDADVAKFFDFLRFIAAFGLQNTLLVRPVNREQCADQLSAIDGSVPIIATELQSAMLDEYPAQGEELDSRIRTAVDALETVGGDPNPSLTRETLERVGAHPPIKVIYRNIPQSPSRLRELDVVRIGSVKNTYAVFIQKANGDTGVAALPLRIVGDTRCARYYVWP